MIRAPPGEVIQVSQYEITLVNGNHITLCNAPSSPRKDEREAPLVIKKQPGFVYQTDTSTNRAWALREHGKKCKKLV